MLRLSLFIAHPDGAGPANCVVRIAARQQTSSGSVNGPLDDNASLAEKHIPAISINRDRVILFDQLTDKPGAACGLRKTFLWVPKPWAMRGIR